MFVHCPHCRYLVATDPHTQAAPDACPRCGRSMAQVAETAATSADEADSAIAPDHPADSEALSASSIEASVNEDVPANSVAVAASSSVSGDTRDAGNETNPTSDARISVNESCDAANLHGAESGPREDAVAAGQASGADNHGEVVPLRPVTKRSPAFAQPGSPRRWRRARWPWAALPLLVIMLAGQILLADRDRFAADAQWRPIVSALCSVFGCTLPPWHEPSAFTMLDRDVRPLEGMAGVLQARATFRNDAQWSQHWPILLLTLKDADGRTLGARAITPADYLQEAAEGELAPGQSAQIVVHVREPGTQVVAFSFDFR